MKNENFLKSLITAAIELFDRIVLPKSTIDLMKINAVSDKAVKAIEARDYHGIRDAMHELILLELSTVDGDTKRKYTVKLCEFIL